MEQNQQQVSMESVSLYLGSLDLTIIALKEQLMQKDKAIEDLQQQLFKLTKEK